MIKFEGTLDELMEIAKQLLLKQLSAPAEMVERHVYTSTVAVRALLQAAKTGDKISQTRAVREICNLGLKDAKDLVEGV